MNYKLGIGVGHSPSSRNVVLLNLNGLQGPSVPVAICCCTHSGGLPVDGVLVSLNMDCYAILHIHLLYGISVFSHPCFMLLFVSPMECTNMPHIVNLTE